MAKRATYRAEVLENAPLLYAPHNELGVVFLFAHLAKRWRLRIETIRQGFPDCIAYQKVGGREKRIRIEFEYKARNFKTHRHSASKCDWVVCWENNWADPPRNLRIIELRREYGLGFNVWAVPVEAFRAEWLHGGSRWSWSVPPQGHEGDLLIFYVKRPEKSLRFVYRLTSDAKKKKADWKKGMDHFAGVQKVYEMRSPIFLEDLKSDRVLSTAPFVRGNFQGRNRATEYWPYLYRLILRRNPTAARPLSKYDPAALP